MEDLKKAIEKELRDLEQLRDEVKLQAHLGKAEFQAALGRLEDRWPEVETKIDEIKQESKESFESIATSARGLIEELKTGYQSLNRKK